MHLSCRRDQRVGRSGGDIGGFLHLLLGCFLASVLVCGCYCFSCMLGQRILPLINTPLTPWISSRKASAGIFIYCFFSSVMCAASSREGMEFTCRAVHLNAMRCALCIVQCFSAV